MTFPVIFPVGVSWPKARPAAARTKTNNTTIPVLFIESFSLFRQWNKITSVISLLSRPATK